ncbi:hypothetical protein BJX63DRAFT_387802 [Aspergillus granulosus]|uniref:Uncharacterized protein n=1 Tax=Aspergillus granulosus TaxID=176169 RepID=A0ABR4HLC2_9EURO
MVFMAFIRGKYSISGPMPGLSTPGSIGLTLGNILMGGALTWLINHLLATSAGHQNWRKEKWKHQHAMESDFILDKQDFSQRPKSKSYTHTDFCL